MPLPRLPNHIRKYLPRSVLFLDSARRTYRPCRTKIGMRQTLWLATLLPCLAMAACAQTVSGTWQGTLHAQADLREIVRIDKARDGAWAASISSIDQSPD